MLKGLIIAITILLPSVVFSQNLIITEVQVRGESSKESFIKIHNPAPTNLNIAGFRLRKKSSTGKEYSIRVFPKDSFIPAKGYFIWANSRNDYHVSIGADTWSTASLSSNNSLALFNNDREIIDSLAWGTGNDQFKKGNPFDQNPEKGEIIKRKINDGEYKNTGSNNEDFFIYPERINNEIIDNVFLEKTASLEKNKPFPFFSALMVAIFSSLVVLSIKKLN
ncbi:MAG: lamin tail domain-containing protein [Candidatus Nealsonbacteria bacterium]|nr:lamin tail domain-containing protein [Candidatus Nealsonbacteria bacterium]